MAKATHTGHCQLCGHNQMLPNGVLAKHGYTKQWGFFSGTCPGSHHLPYEKSCDEIKKLIPDVQKSVWAKREVIAGLEATPFTATNVRLNVYTEKLKYHWIQTEVRFTRHESSVSGWWYTVEGLVPARRTSDSIWADVQVYGHNGSELEILRHLTSQYIERALKPQLMRSEEYLNWLSKRAADWKFRDCKERE